MAFKKLSDAMRAVLRNLSVGKPADFGQSGMSAAGGLTGTMRALRKRGLVDNNGTITQAGRDAARTGLYD